ncbi:MAG: DNRLRE domain-containing protein [Clostridiales bacterium]|nr:DNRLRE domain-containing protein [Clostridiales bacterium]
MFHRKRRRLIALLLAFAALTAFSPPPLANAQVPERLYELTGKRTASSKTYLLDNGQLQTVVYAGDVHYLTEASRYEEIDNSITGCVTSRKSGRYSYQNKANRFTARFSSDMSQFPVLLEYRDHSIAMRPKGAAAATGTLYSDCSAEYKEAVDYYIGASNSIVYADAYANIDLIYDSRDNGVKELIVIKAPADRNEFDFELMLDNVTAAMAGDKICFNDSGGRTIFTLGELFAVDAAGEYTDDVSASLVTNQKSCSIKLRINENYLNDPQREYPIIIDPSVMVTGSTNTADAFVRSGNPSTNYKMDEKLFIGNSPAYGLQRSYIKFTLPTDISASSVTNVIMKLKLYGGTSTAMNAYRVTSSWTSGGITWNNKPGYSSANASGTSSVYSGSWYALDVTTVTRQHLAGTYSNYGFVLISQSESGTSTSTSFYSSDAPSPNKPELVITYQNSNVYYGCRPYEYSTGYTQNCMGYALDKAVYVEYGDLGYISPGNLWNRTIQELTTDYVGRIETWMNNNMGTRDYYSIASYSSNIALAEYRVATKVAFYDADGNGLFNSHRLQYGDYQNPDNPDDNLEYHWWYQTETGVWAQKNGGGASSLMTGVTNPGTYVWFNDPAVIEGAVKYYAVEADIAY